MREAYLRDNSQSPDKARRLAQERDNQIKQQQREFDKYKTYICVINYNNTNHIINKLQIIYNICNRG